MTLAEQVLQALLEHRRTISVAESCTGGLLAKEITDIPGASALFPCGIVCYDNRIKNTLLCVPEKVLQTEGAVSDKTARYLAQGVRRLGDTDLGVGITGIAGPTGATPEKPVGLIFIALADDRGTRAERLETGSADRAANRETAVRHAFGMILRYLAELAQTR